MVLVKIRDDEFQYLCELLYQSYGLNMRKKRVLIEYRLMNILQKYQVNSFQEYFSLLRTDKSGKMKEEMLNKLTTNYSFFMREPQHFEFIKKEILPKLCVSKPFSVWIAGCSYGQECYTLAMILEELRLSGMVLPPVNIYATDINTVALEQAKTGIYPKEAIANLPELWRKRFCRSLSDGTIQLKECIRKQVTFEYHNIMEPYDKRKFHLIMCRNVLIYFDERSRNKIYQRFYNSLQPKGFLILGMAEMILQNHVLFKYHGASIYQVKESVHGE